MSWRLFPQPAHFISTIRLGASARRWSSQAADRSRARSLSASGAIGFGRPTFASCATTSLRNFFRPAVSLVQVGQAAAQPPPQCFSHSDQQCLPKLSISRSIGISERWRSTKARASSRSDGGGGALTVGSVGLDGSGVGCSPGSVPVPVLSSSKEKNSTPVVTPGSGSESSTLFASTTPGSLFFNLSLEEEFLLGVMVTPGGE